MSNGESKPVCPPEARNVDDDWLDARYWVLDQNLKWLAANGHKEAADALFARDRIYLFERPADLLAKAIRYLNLHHPMGRAAWTEHDYEVQALVDLMRPANAPCCGEASSRGVETGVAQPDEVGRGSAHAKPPEGPHQPKEHRGSSPLDAGSSPASRLDSMTSAESALTAPAFHTCPFGSGGFYPDCNGCVHDMQAGRSKGAWGPSGPPPTPRRESPKPERAEEIAEAMVDAIDAWLDDSRNFKQAAIRTLAQCIRDIAALDEVKP